MPATFLIGALYGDEGKGRVAAALAPDFALAVRGTGGGNANHDRRRWPIAGAAPRPVRRCGRHPGPARPRHARAALRTPRRARLVGARRR
ncbi:MAG: adenylosuccinate synthetase [Deltaproteobacteria bacterium]|nr:adenylosuccinate synthetase [Deltaproteobacteria bacterium]